MKLLSLTIKNVGLIADETIHFNAPLMIFYGAVRQGKTTILNAVRWCFGGPFPQDIIRHGAREALVTLTFEGGSITREWYVSKDQTTIGRTIQFIRDGKLVTKPSAEIAKLLNPFVLNQNHLVDMNEPERKAFFAQLFGVDTADLDGEAITVSQQASELRAKIKGYGDIDLTPVEMPDVEGLRKQLETARAEHATMVEGKRAEFAEIMAEHRAACDDAGRKNSWRERRALEIAQAKRRLAETDIEIQRLRDRISELEVGREELVNAANLSLLEITPMPTRRDTTALEQAVISQPDTREIEDKISAAAADEVRHKQFLANKARAEKRSADELRLLELERRGRDIKHERASRLQGISDEAGIEGLAFNENGEFTYQYTAAGMLSTSQLMKLSSELSAKYPEGFGIELLDRGESLGTSIFEYVKRARAQQKTIMATVVGERPAEVPEHVGVYVVENGKVAAG